MKRLIVCACVAVAGCADTAPVPPSKLARPAAALMVTPEPLSQVQAGDDLYQSHARLRRSYGRETSKLKRLQRWVRTVTK